MALIKCKKCGNPASSKSKACPICGEPIATVESTAPVAPQSVESATPEQPKAESIAAAQPKTLNDIIAERGAQPKTLNERLAESSTSANEQPAAQSTAEPTNKSTATPVIPVVTPAAEPTDNGSNQRIDDYEEELTRKDRTIKGYKTMLIILVLILLPLAYFMVTYIGKVKSIEQDYALVESARKIFEEQNTMLQHEASDLVAELESLKDKNDTMMVKYQEAVVMLEQLQKEKTYNYEQLARYKREVNTLKNVMKGYLRQIDSLNVINKDLQAQNIEYKKEITTAELRADIAEEKADELNTKVRIGAVIRTSGIRMTALNGRGNETKRIRQAERLRTDFELTANELAEPGEKSIYICITGPDGYQLSSPEMIVFMFEGEEMMASAMRKVDYENQSVPVSIYYDGAAFEKGTYKVDIYIDGRHCGSQETYFE